MLALARARLARAGLTHCAVRLADMYRLPLADAGFDFAVLQMVLHYAEDPAGVLGRGPHACCAQRPPGRHRPGAPRPRGHHGQAGASLARLHRRHHARPAGRRRLGAAAAAHRRRPLAIRVWAATRAAAATAAAPVRSRELAI